MYDKLLQTTYMSVLTIIQQDSEHFNEEQLPIVQSFKHEQSFGPSGEHPGIGATALLPS